MASNTHHRRRTQSEPAPSLLSSNTMALRSAASPSRWSFVIPKQSRSTDFRTAERCQLEGHGAAMQLKVSFVRPLSESCFSSRGVTLIADPTSSKAHGLVLDKTPAAVDRVLELFNLSECRSSIRTQTPLADEDHTGTPRRLPHRSMHQWMSDYELW